MNIYIYKNDQRQGPYTSDEIQRKLSSGELCGKDLGWHDGCPDWIELQNIRAVFQSPPTPLSTENSSIDNFSKINNKSQGVIKRLFANVFNYSLKRDRIEVVGFYVTYTFFIMLLSVFIPSIFPVIFGYSSTSDGFSENYQVGVQQGARIATISCGILSQVVLASKGLNRWSIKYILVSALSCVLAFLGGAIAGLIPVAWLTTLDCTLNQKND